MRIKTIITAVFTGVFLVGSVWAGIGLTPIGVDEGIDGSSGSTMPSAIALADVGVGTGLGADEALVGASKVSLFPTPDESAGEVWVRDKPKCTPLTSGDAQTSLDHAADPRVTWIENNGCIYMGGFGIGPSQPVIQWDMEDDAVPVYAANGSVNMRGYGLWVRTVAISKGGQTVIASILDAEGYFGDYARMCGATPCGAFALGERIATEIGGNHPSLGISPDSLILASTHAHSAMDYIGGWGGVPQWYMDQTAAAIVESARLAVESMQPATIVAGDVLARPHNGERRDLYYSAEDPSLNWFRAIDRSGETITVVGSFSAHATSFGGSAILAHADWPGVFEKRVEERFVGEDGIRPVGLMFEAGLGNMSSRGGWAMGAPLADLVPADGGRLVTDPVVKVGRTYWDQPITNGPLAALGGGGFFDRPFGGPATVDTGKAEIARCRSASAISVRTSVTAAKVGGLFITAAPGEIFANYSNTIEERAPISAIAIGQANDAIGYMPQSFESDHKSRQGGGFLPNDADVGDQEIGFTVFDYEDAYSIDGCFGDMALQSTLDLLASL